MFDLGLGPKRRRGGSSLPREIRKVRAPLYKTERTLGDVEAALRGPDYLAKRLIRRRLWRAIGRAFR